MPTRQKREREIRQRHPQKTMVPLPAKHKRSLFGFPLWFSLLLDSHRLGQVAREIHVEALEDSEPVGDELQRNDVEETLEAVHSLGDLNLLGLGCLKLLVAGVADDNGLAASGNDCDTC